MLGTMMPDAQSGVSSARNGGGDSYLKGAIVLAFAAFVCCALYLSARPATAWADEDASAAYQIYPTPHSVAYADGEVELPKTVQAVVEDGIDDVTVGRLEEALDLKGSKMEQVEEIPTEGEGTSVLVGIHGSKGAVDTYVDKLVEESKLTYTDKLFDQTDSYVLAVLPAEDGSTPGQIIVLGRDTDSAYYGLTTLYQILQQVEGSAIRALTISDYADVPSRGFIEGYYGEPWSTEDRVNLMAWGGYYKANVYFYAPKDDPKHNSKWWELYTDEELESKVKPLAEAGNASKCRFVFALHPFMSNPITNNDYDAKLKQLKDKFFQVIDKAGVRQIAILADDAGNQGQELYIKLCKDVTDWLHELQKERNADGTAKYEGLKDTLIFCPVNYMGWGEGWYSQLPENVRVINTGGQVWGTVDNNFVSSFKNNSNNVSPFMWINWPCTDNTKSGLIMGGHDDFLAKDVQPGTLMGLILNPMQQSEPSKQAIFMAADFTWNLWDENTDTQQTWDDSFSYIDHNSPIPTDGSNALRELSKHMMESARKGGDQGESAEIKDELTAFQNKLQNGIVAAEDFDAIAEIFENLQQAAKTYRAEPGNKAMFEQIQYWIDAWDDATAAMLDWCAAGKADLAGDSSTLVERYSAGQEAYVSYGTHGFSYIDHTEYAKVGINYITPTLKALGSYLAGRVQIAVDPNAFATTYVSDVFIAPTSGKISDITDGDVSTGATFQSPNFLYKDNYIGITFNRPADVDSVSFTMGGGKNHMYYGQLQVTYDGETWENVEGKTFTQNDTGSGNHVYEETGLGLKDAMGVRIIATQNNGVDLWLKVLDISVNSVKEEGPEAGAFDIKLDGITDSAYSGSNYKNLADGDTSTIAYLYSTADKDHMKAGSGVELDFAAPTAILGASITHDGSSASDKPAADGLEFQYKTADSDEWVTFGTYDGQNSQTVKLDEPVTVTAVRAWLTKDKANWWRIAEFTPILADSSAYMTTIELDKLTSVTEDKQYSEEEWGKANAIDGDAGTVAAFYTTGNKDKLSAGSAFALSFDRAIELAGATVTLDSTKTADFPTNAKVQYKDADSGKWVDFGTFTKGTLTQTASLEETVKATGIRMLTTQADGVWWRIAEFAPILAEDTGATSEGITSNIEGVEFTMTNAGGEAKLTNVMATFGEGDSVVMDLGAVRDDVVVTSSLPASVVVRVSQNGLEWSDYKASDGFQARYVGIFAADGTKGEQVAIRDFAVSYRSVKAPSFLSASFTVGGSAEYAPDEMIDGDINTLGTLDNQQQEGEVAIFDLGQEREISSIRYEIPEAKTNFIRDAVIEVAESPDAEEWTQVLDINESGEYDATDASKNDTAKDAAWLTHDDKNPGNMYCEDSLDTPVTARYVRLRFTGTYTWRWISGDILVNGGEWVSDYGDADFVQSGSEVEGKSPANMLDGDLLTTWQPADDEGSLTYHISAPLKADGKTPYAGIRFVSSGKVSGATVTATIYTDESYTETETVELGTLSQAVADFRFGGVVKDVTISWKDGARPAISEIYMLSSLEDTVADAIANAEKLNADDYTTASWQNLQNVIEAARGNHDASKDAELVQSIMDAQAQLVNIKDLKAAVAKAKGIDPSLFTEESVAALNEAVATAEGLYENGTVEQAAAAIKALNEAYEALAPIEPAPEIHTVTFNDRFGTKVRVQVQDGKTIAESQIPADPSQTGWKFTGWCVLDASGALRPFDFSQSITSSFELFANWEKIDGGSGETPVTPEDPNHGDATETPDAGTEGFIPQTGDNSMLAIGTVVIVAVVAIVAGLVLRARSKK